MLLRLLVPPSSALVAAQPGSAQREYRPGSLAVAEMVPYFAHLVVERETEMVPNYARLVVEREVE